PREVLIAVVHRLELAAVDGDASRLEKTHLTAELNEAPTDLAQRQAVVLAKVSNRFVIGSQPPSQPHHLDIAPSLALQPAARLHAIEISVDVKLQQDRWMVRGPAGC